MEIDHQIAKYSTLITPLIWILLETLKFTNLTSTCQVLLQIQAIWVSFFATSKVKQQKKMHQWLRMLFHHQSRLQWIWDVEVSQTVFAYMMVLNLLTGVVESQDQVVGASIFGNGFWWVFMAVSDSGGRGTDLVFENFNCGEVGGSDEGDFVLEDLNGGDG